MGIAGIVALMVLFTAVTVALLYTTVAIWPGTEPDSDVIIQRYFLGQPISLDRDRSIFVVVVLGGALGATLHVLRSFSEYVGERRLRWSWVPRYVLLPLIGAVLASVVFVVLRAGLLQGPVGADGNPFGFVAIGILVGLFSGQSMEKLKQVFETVLTPVPPRGDSLGKAAPVITESPATVVVGTEALLRGTGLDDVTEVVFTQDLAAPARWSADEGVLKVTVPAGATTGLLMLRRGQQTFATTSVVTVSS